ncbi:MAG TPA: DUF2188 domain-containing protein [Longimicrobium sp.]|uniref:DUF2188 domain-containing protein n=1 Tax=Longimicrobium sp. TaxID=2029185 RepID=UPI002EDAB430
MDRPDEGSANETPQGQAPGWYVLPKPEGGWRVHDGGKPVPTAVFDRKADAIAFARRQAACPCATAGGRRKRVYIFTRPRPLTPERLRELRQLDLKTPRPAPPGGRTSSGKPRMMWMSDDFDELPAEIAEFFE